MAGSAVSEGEGNIIDATTALSLGSLHRAELKKRVENLPPGHRRTGAIFRRGDPNVPSAALPRKVPAREEHEVAVKKSQAISIAVTLTKGKARAAQEGGYCILHVKVRGVPWFARETSWWRCLRALRAKLAPPATPAA